MTRTLGTAVFALAGLALSTLAARAQTVSAVLSFPTTIQGAASGVVLGSDGFLYGTALATNSVYKVAPDGTGFQIIHTFPQPDGHGFNFDGYYPSRELVAPGDGYLYGDCANGGDSGNGTIYRISASGAFQRLYSFTAEDSSFHNADGAGPQSGLAVNGDGFLYGTTKGGGPNGEGTVFRISRDGTGFQMLHAFTFSSATDGSNTYAPLLWGGNGFFYGTTQSGGANFFGTIYQIKPDGTGFSLLHSFTGAEGGSFTAPTLGRDGRLYGVSFQGGANLAGLLWGINTDGTGFAPVHVFGAKDSQNNNLDGSGPYGALATGPDGTLYGTTESGGINKFGTVFAVHPDGSQFTTLASFGTNSGDPNDPVGSLELIGNVIYGTTSYGGPIGFGTLFQISGLPGSAPPPGHAHLLWNKTDGTASLWTVNSDGTFATVAYGPFSGWTARATAAAPDGTNWLLWTNTNGTASLWHVTALTASGYTATQYGPYPAYSAVSLSVGSDGSPHLLWDKTDGTANLWTVNPASGSFTYTPYGPYAGWTARSIASGATVTDLLWTKTDGTASGYRIASDGSLTYHTFGPYTGYTATSLSVGPDDGAHLLWDKTDGTALLWSVDFSTGAFTYTPYGPFSGYAARAIATGPDNVTHILWNATNGVASLWNVTGSGYTYTAYGPYSGWTAVAVSAGP